MNCICGFEHNSAIGLGRHKENDYNQLMEKSADEIWEKDLERDILIESAGFQILHIWKSEYISKPEQTINKCLSFINSNIPGDIQQIETISKN